MTIQETIDALVTAEDYMSTRLSIDDNVVSYIKIMFADDYAYFEEKEVEYQKTMDTFKTEKV